MPQKWQKIWTNSCSSWTRWKQWLGGFPQRFSTTVFQGDAQLSKALKSPFSQAREEALEAAAATMREATEAEETPKKRQRPVHISIIFISHTHRYVYIYIYIRMYICIYVYMYNMYIYIYILRGSALCRRPRGQKCFLHYRNVVSSCCHPKAKQRPIQIIVLSWPGRNSDGVEPVEGFHPDLFLSRSLREWHPVPQKARHVCTKKSIKSHHPVCTFLANDTHSGCEAHRWQSK